MNVNEDVDIHGVITAYIMFKDSALTVAKVPHIIVATGSELAACLRASLNCLLAAWPAVADPLRDDPKFEDWNTPEGQSEMTRHLGRTLYLEANDSVVVDAALPTQVCCDAFEGLEQRQFSDLMIDSLRILTLVKWFGVSPWPDFVWLVVLSNDANDIAKLAEACEERGLAYGNVALSKNRPVLRGILKDVDVEGLGRMFQERWGAVPWRHLL